MYEYLVKRIMSLAISSLLIYVPRESVEKEMSALPDMVERIKGKDLHGWTLENRKSDSLRMTHYYYFLAGPSLDAPYIICLHGFNTDGRVFLNLKPLAKKYDLAAYNFPESSPYYHGSLSDFKILLDDFIGGFFAENEVVLVGNSIGGGVAQHYIASGPNVPIRKLVLLSTEVFGATPKDRQQYRGMADKLLPYPDYKLFYLFQKGQALVTRLERTELGANAPSEVIVSKKIDWYRQILTSLYDYDGTSDARRISVPVLAVHGATDRVITQAAAQSIEYIVPNVTYVELQGVGHSMVYSEGERVAEIIEQFVESQAQHVEDGADR